MEYTGGLLFDTINHTPHQPNPLLRRGCVQCPPTTPSCPVCQSHEVCVQISQTCDQCASRACVKSSDSGATPISNRVHGPNVGAIAGGVVGGCAFIAIVTFLIWRFFLKNRRQDFNDDVDFDEDDELEQAANGSEKAPNVRSRRGSTSTARRSMASTVLTRASNVIPIAFIPMAVERNNRGLVPPVPVPTASGLQTPYADEPQDHYFMPSDLRDSHYSGFTDDGASSLGRASVTPSLLRQSVASTIYHGSATVVGAGQTARRGQAAVVSVPAVPKINPKYTGGGLEAVGEGQQLPASTFSPLARTIAPPREEQQRERPISNPLSDKHAIPEGEEIDESDEAGSLASSLQSRAVARAPPNVGSMIEQATRRASRLPTHGGLGSVERGSDGRERGTSPFGDEYVVEDEDEQQRPS